jgi:hypothetical protein
VDCVAEETAVVEIDIVRSAAFFFYNRREAGREPIIAQRIPAERARQIYEANEANDWQRITGRVSFDATPCEWSWTTRIAL